jgi:8-oxo-dGTP pyrophosphatase MutT (NUDIX family)
VLLDHPESVSIIAIEDDALLVVIQSRPGARQPTVELPAGCLEPGEPATEAAIRELREECSMAARRWLRIGGFLAAPSYSTEFVHVFEARCLEPDAGLQDPDEDITVDHRALSDLPDALSDATSIAAFALWRERQRSAGY